MSTDEQASEFDIKCKCLRRECASKVLMKCIVRKGLLPNGSEATAPFPEDAYPCCQACAEHNLSPANYAVVRFPSGRNISVRLDMEDTTASGHDKLCGLRHHAMPPNATPLWYGVRGSDCRWYVLDLSDQLRTAILSNKHDVMYEHGMIDTALLAPLCANHIAHLGHRTWVHRAPMLQED